VPKIDIAAVPERNTTSYPEPFRQAVSGRFFRALGQAGNLTQFGVNLVRLTPGAWSSQRHWHEKEDEFLMVLEGELVLVEDEGETILATPPASRPACRTATASSTARSATGCSWSSARARLPSALITPTSISFTRRPTAGSATPTGQASLSPEWRL
jgi:Cupin domain